MNINSLNKDYLSKKNALDKTFSDFDTPPAPNALAYLNPAMWVQTFTNLINPASPEPSSCDSDTFNQLMERCYSQIPSGGAFDFQKTCKSQIDTINKCQEYYQNSAAMRYKEFNSLINQIKLQVPALINATQVLADAHQRNADQGWKRFDELLEVVN